MLQALRHDELDGQEKLTALKNRYDFVFFFDVTNGNPNGDPDAGNMPRLDPDTNHGLVSDVAIKRKVRDYVMTAHEGEPGHDIYLKNNIVLNEQHERAYKALGVAPRAKPTRGGLEETIQLQKWMCETFFDIRTFGAVMTTEVNCGQVRGPVQITFARSVEEITPMEVSIIRSSVTNRKDRSKGRTMGRKFIVPYGLYCAHGFVNAKLAEKTGFSDADLTLLWTALRDMFELERSASHGEMVSRQLIAFRHESALGNGRSHELFDLVKVGRRVGSEVRDIGAARKSAANPARGFADYEVSVDRGAVPAGVSVLDVF